MRAATIYPPYHPELRKFISIHAAHEGCDYGLFFRKKLRMVFQSTQPMRAATDVLYIDDFFKTFQSTQPMRAAT